MNEYPGALVNLEARPGAIARETSVAAMKRIALRDEWEGYDLDNTAAWAGVYRWMSVARVLPEEDHVTALKHFFVESIRQLR